MLELKGRRVFLIHLRGTNRKFIFQTATELIEILKLNIYGIAFIKEYKPSKLSFGRIDGGIESFITCFNHNTELVEDYFNKINYFK